MPLNDALTTPAKEGATKPSRWFPDHSTCELIGFLMLAGLLVFFLKTSWRKWPDPMVDFGHQCYCTWRLSQGARLYHDLDWYYGPLSIYLNAGLFKIFGPGIMVLVTANLIVYAAILVLMYIAFRRAWGWPGAFSALAVFISVFSFSHLLDVGNYNYATPYSAEATHGMLLILVAAFLAVEWTRKPSKIFALGVGLCGGLSVVLKPEFMLATAAVGIGAYALRWTQRLRVSVAEHVWLLLGVVLPSAMFTIWFARGEPWPTAFEDANKAWWLVVVKQVQRESNQQLQFSGFNRPLPHLLSEIESVIGAVVLMSAVSAVGWFINRSWSVGVRVMTSIAAFALVGLLCWKIDWFDAGRCLAGLMVIAAILSINDLARELRKIGRVDAGTVMSLFLVLLGGTMLARMALYPHVSHLGFYQSAVAAMVAAAMMMSNLPRLAGEKFKGQIVSAFAAMSVLIVGCSSIAARSLYIRGRQIQSVGSGRDQFFSTTRDDNANGLLVDWATTNVMSLPPQAIVLVLPEGTMVNYLTRHRTTEPPWGAGLAEEDFLARLQKNPPDYVVFITRDLTEFGIQRFGVEGNFGSKIATWAKQNYWLDAHIGYDPLSPIDRPGAILLRLREKPK